MHNSDSIEGVEGEHRTEHGERGYGKKEVKGGRVGQRVPLPGYY